jgi:hypothetical protein
VFFDANTRRGASIVSASTTIGPSERVNFEAIAADEAEHACRMKIDAHVEKRRVVHRALRFFDGAREAGIADRDLQRLLKLQCL